ncbi:MAG: HEAT repeat domain-containing protein [Pleurocapsa sp. MO_226.B13]|nr:HEAT repeat domain-containing protein [Pleurocapsa sp. MO_226.B13]
MKNQQQEVYLTIASTLGGAVGGIGHHHYNKNYNASSIQGTIASDALSGLIAGFIGITFIALKFKKEYSLRQVCAIAMGIGLAFHAVFGGIKSIVTAQTQIYRLQREVETEQSESIEKIQALAARGDSYVKQEAIEKLAEIGKRSNQPEKSIAAIQNLARDSSDEEVKQEAIEGLTDIASESESFTVVEEAVEAIVQSTELKSKEEVIRHLKELERLATEAATVEKRQVLIESISEYEGQYDEEVDRSIEEIRSKLLNL